MGRMKYIYALAIIAGFILAGLIVSGLGRLF